MTEQPCPDCGGRTRLHVTNRVTGVRIFRCDDCAARIEVPAMPTALEQVESLIARGQLRICGQTKPLTEEDAALLLEFHDQLSKRPGGTT